MAMSYPRNPYTPAKRTPTPHMPAGPAPAKWSAPPRPANPLEPITAHLRSPGAVAHAREVGRRLMGLPPGPLGLHEMLPSLAPAPPVVSTAPAGPMPPAVMTPRTPSKPRTLLGG